MAYRVRRDKMELSLNQQLEHAFRIAVARIPNQRECDTLKRLYESELASNLQGEQDSGAVKTSDAEQAQSAAWFAVASALLNLDETITKE